MHIEFEKTTMDDYLKQRHLLIAKDAKNRTGQNIVLTDSEKKANDIIMSFKRKELLSDFASQQTLSAQSFITAKPKIEESNVFKIIQKMPKGKYSEAMTWLYIIELHHYMTTTLFLDLCMCKSCAYVTGSELKYHL